MTGAQILTLALLGIFAASWFNNSRIGDMRGALEKRIEDMRDVLRAEMRAERAETNTRMERFEAKLDAILKVCADLDIRVTRLEQR